MGYSSPIAKTSKVNTHIQLEITPWEIHEEAFVPNTACDLVDATTFLGKGQEPSHTLGKKIWNQILRENQENSSDSRGIASSVIPFGNMASAGASMVTGLIKGARALLQNKKNLCPRNITVKNMTKCTMVIQSYGDCQDGYHESSFIPAGEDSSLMLTDTFDDGCYVACITMYVVGDDEKNDCQINLNFKKEDGFTQLSFVTCNPDNASHSTCDPDTTPNKYNIKPLIYQVHRPLEDNIVIGCTTANHSEEQELTLTFAQ